MARKPADFIDTICGALVCAGLLGFLISFVAAVIAAGSR